VFGIWLLKFKNNMRDYDIIVIGAGHAGCEAALAGARMGLDVAIFTMNLETIGQMSCNPAVGGLGKSHLVKEIDALGGEMARVTDKGGIQFKVLNKSKGPAVWATRVQCDRVLYRKLMRETLESQENLNIKQEMVKKILIENDRVSGIETFDGVYRCKALVVATGTFLNGLIHVGLENFPSGRAGESPSIELSQSLRELGFRMGRLKTGTPPRLNAGSIDFSQMGIQESDVPPPPMSLFTKEIKNPLLPCYITYTNENTHKIILENLKFSPLYSGVIKGIGPRYCPSIEDKVVRFRDKTRHQIFLEPEGIDSYEYYANGISTSLPKDVQIKIVQSIAGLEQAEIRKFGYAIEYDFVYPTQLKPTLETKQIEGLFLAGQINGTSGYEEAAAQGLIAGINAGLKIKNKEPFILRRDEAYIGVLIDDLVTKGTNEPYRMFTSRAEYRLLLRQDNADLRLMKKGYKIGLISEEDYSNFLQKKSMIEEEIKRLKHERAKPEVINPILRELCDSEVKEDTTLYHLLKRPEVRYSDIVKISLPQNVIEQVEIQIKYEGYIERQAGVAERFKRIEEKEIPHDFAYKGIPGLSREIVEKLEEVRPINLGQATRIPGVTPAAISLLEIVLKRESQTRQIR